MSPEIMWRDGGPLMLAGLVGGSSRCCCENPPPPNCYTPDHCSYYVEILSPEIVRVKSPTKSCQTFFDDYSKDTSQPEWIFDGIEFLPGWDLCGSSPQCGLLGLCSVQPNVRGVAATGVHAEVSFSAYFCGPDPFDHVIVTGSAQITLTVTSTGGAFTGTPQISLDYRIRGQRFVLADYGRLILHSSAFITRGATIFPKTFCLYNDKRSCGAPGTVLMPPHGFKYIETPLEVLLEPDSATLNGDTTALEGFTDSFSNYGSAAPLAAFIEAISNAFSATFRITSRPSCREVPAGCEVPIGEGHTPVAWGDEEFVLGTFKFSSQTGPNNTSEEYEHLEGNADGYIFWFYRKNSQGILLDAQYIELFCDLDDTVSPAVNRWYVYQTVYCYEDGASGLPHSIDEWIGTIPTYESTGCHNIAVGDPVPIGTADLERVPGFPVSYFGATCVPPAPIPLEIQAPCGGG